MRPFELPNGPITRDAYKALLLQLDPDDDEAERAIRMALEKNTAARLRRIFNRINGDFREYYPEEMEADMLRAMEAYRRAYDRNRPQLADALSRALLQGVDLGVQVAVDQFENIGGFGFDWTMTNTRARDWAEQYAGQLIRDIDVTTERMVQQSVSRWIGNQEPLQRLIDDLRAVPFSEQRAQLIAQTEITRAFAEGTIESYIDSGLVSGPPEIRPPNDSHPGCRCWPGLIEDGKGNWSYIWLTSADEKVCPICGKLANRKIAVVG
ncbi:hypothetical protein LCGC14_0386820 [marine sediment metagenome]|uniref:Phage head morphogenesis domain-containing protein n=1 Tax=marine sediment metagenome TaxID=412755 RepID=A0A0F9T6H4_9ZZZZ